MGTQRAILPTPPKSAPITVAVDGLCHGYGTKEKSCCDICRLPQEESQTGAGTVEIRRDETLKALETRLQERNLGVYAYR